MSDVRSLVMEHIRFRAVMQERVIKKLLGRWVSGVEPELIIVTRWYSGINPSEEEIQGLGYAGVLVVPVDREDYT